MHTVKLCGHLSLVTNDCGFVKSLLDGSGKLQVLVSLLKSMKQNGHRCLVFSQSTMMLDIIESVLEDESIELARIDGNTEIEDRQDLVDSFNEDHLQYDAMLLSTKTGELKVNYFLHLFSLCFNSYILFCFQYKVASD